jgi:CubicO group peptidase (beta-lactamase class C family)
MIDQAPVEGTVAAGYEGVREAFERNFVEEGERGASCAVYVDGELKVDLWGGVADAATGRPWTEDTLALVYSATKGATAILCNLLAERGELELDVPVADYWPEFAANGKAGIPVRMLLTHEAGLPVVEARLTREEVLEWTLVVEALAAQAPLWEPGTAHGYHALTCGWLLGEVVRRATGRPLGQLFAELVATPLGLDLFIGLPATEESRVAALLDAPPPDMRAVDQLPDPSLRESVLEMIAAMEDSASLLARALSTNGALPAPDARSWNDPRVRAAELPAANGVTNARSLARMYAACIGEVDGVRLLHPRTLDDATVERVAGPDRVLVVPTRFGTGFTLPSPLFRPLSEASFGHAGAGGALGFADRDAGVGFGYVQNQGGSAPAGDPRTARLVEAIRTALSD